MTVRAHLIGATFVSVILLCGCSSSKSKAKLSGTGPAADGVNEPRYGDLVLRDDAFTNVAVDPAAMELSFVDLQGAKIELSQFRDKKNVMLVMTRGFPGSICPYCVTQTSRLIANYKLFADRNTEIVVAFPGEENRIKEFVAQTKAKTAKPESDVPFPIVLDEGFKAVDRLGIRGDLAKPSTYIIDKMGQIRYAHVGSDPSDRPSIRLLLSQLDSISGSKG